MNYRIWNCKSKSEWLSRRAGFLSSTDASVILCKSGRHGRTPLSVYHSKVTPELELQLEETEAMRWGLRHEGTISDAVRDEYADYSIVTPSSYTLFISTLAGYEFAAATPDRFVTSKSRPELGTAPLEIKTSSIAADWELGIPPNYRIQVLHQAAVVGAKWAVVAVLINGNQLRVYELLDIEDEIEELRANESEWWNKHVFSKVEPDIEAGDSNLVRRLVGNGIENLSMTLNSEAEMLVAEIQQFKKAAKDLSDQIDARNARLMAILGDHTEGLGTNFRVTFKMVERKGYVVNPSQSRVLNIYPVKQPKK